jgi:3',5'-cyclic AMP phosphodiesterase CpdA
MKRATFLQFIISKRPTTAYTIGLLFVACLLLIPSGWLHAITRDFTNAALNPAPSAIPDRVILTWAGDPSVSQAVTWRTDASVEEAYAEIAIADPSPDFIDGRTRVKAITTPLKTQSGLAHYHSVNFTDLAPNTQYAFRVGGETGWSEWFQFRTASDRPQPFSFIYIGDAQKAILSLWSRAIRAAVLDDCNARFIIHAGDLVNHGNNDPEWGEWFEAAGWINGMISSIPAIGNHEYYRIDEKGTELSPLWRPQFTLPQVGIEGIEETVYAIDYQGCRIVVLNSCEKLDVQAQWLEGVLKDNPHRWTFVTFHHPVYSSAKGRDNKELRSLWKPLFDRYRVDLVLQGHDHTYARGRNLPTGDNERDEQSGTVYVVSVSGPKMYELTDDRWMDVAAENTQLYQVISVSADTLRYRSMTVEGELYDAFYLIKNSEGPNILIDNLPADMKERRFK